MANTVIQLKYSTVTVAPPVSSLAPGESAYSFVSDKFYIGNTTGAILTIGGKYYTDMVDAATSANTVSTVVKRDASGNFSATTISAALSGNAATATKWQTVRDIGVSGDATGIVSVDGTANANVPLTLATVNGNVGTYGGTTNIPVFTVNAKGLITAASNVSVSSSFTVAADTGSNVITNGVDTLTFVGGDGVTTSISTTDSVKIDVDNTVMRTSGGQSITGDLTVTGDLFILGNTVTQNVSTMIVEDSLIQLASSNPTDAFDIGFFGQYVSAGTKYTALFRDATDGKFKLLTAGTETPSAANTVNVAAFSTATLVANITGGTVSSLTSAITVSDGGTGAGTFTAGSILMGNGTGAITALANTGVAGSYGATDRTLAITTDAYGRVSSVTNSAIAISATQISSGTLPIARGGTNQTTFTGGQMIYFDGTSLVSFANTGTAGSYGATDRTLSITTDAWGRVSAVTNSAIALAASQITTGTLGVARGGTGLSTITQNGVLIGQGTGNISTASSSTEGQVLTINASGVPAFANISGGIF